jgi:hypothetical protein
MKDGQDRKTPERSPNGNLGSGPVSASRTYKCPSVGRATHGHSRGDRSRIGGFGRPKVQHRTTSAPPRAAGRGPSGRKGPLTD